jgi:hypothetical protein
MITKQLFTYTQKVERINNIISIRRDRIAKSQEAIDIVEQIIGSEQSDSLDAKLKHKELEIKKLDLIESILENTIQLRIQEEILKEDLAAKERYEKMKAELEAEIEEKWDEYIEKIKQTILDIKRKNKNADTGRLSNAVSKAYEEFENDDEKLDHFKILKDLSNIKA